MEHVNAVDEDSGLVLPHVRRAEWLSNAIGRRYGIGVHHGDVDTPGVPPGDQRMVQIGQSKQHRTAVSSAADQEDAEGTPVPSFFGKNVRDFHQDVSPWNSAPGTKETTRPRTHAE